MPWAWRWLPLARNPGAPPGLHFFIAITLPDKTLTAVWMRGKEYPTVAEQLTQLPIETSHAVQSRQRTELLSTMPRVSLHD